MRPSLVIAQVNDVPALTARKPSGCVAPPIGALTASGSGSAALSTAPRPSCPAPFLPQHRSSPAVVIAQL